MGNSSEIGWSDEQWNRANAAVQETAQKARIAAQFLPTTLYPDPSAVAVPNLALGDDPVAVPPPERRLTVDSTPATFFTSLAVNVALTTQEMADPQQSSALVQFRRVANIIARLEDALIFRGQSARNETPAGAEGIPKVFQVSGGGDQLGLVREPPAGGSYAPRLELDLTQHGGKPHLSPGNYLAKRIIEGVGRLEAAGHNGPFACVLGQNRFSDLHEPSDSLVMPADRVKPVIDGPLLRSSTIPTDNGVLLALGDGGMEVVVSSELHMRFLQITSEPRYVFRVSERVALRISDWSAVLVLHP